MNYNYEPLIQNENANIINADICELNSSTALINDHAIHVRIDPNSCFNMLLPTFTPKKH